MADKKFEVPEGVSIVSKGKKAIEVDMPEFERIAHQATEGSSMQDLLDHYMKMIYLVDTSGSMNESMAEETAGAGTGEYEWTPEFLDEARAALVTAIEDGENILDPDSGTDLTPSKAKKLTVEALKIIARDTGIADEIGVPEKQAAPPPNAPAYNYGSVNTKSKIETVKANAKSWIEARFKKYNDAKVVVMQFEESPRVLSYGQSKEDVLKAFDEMYGGGGTNIFSAVHAAVNECKHRPSEVGAHHLVLISDGCDHGAMRCPELLPKMKELGIVFDFIFMKANYSAVARMFKSMCESTGGEYIECNTVQDFERKFLAVSNRKMLTSGVK